MWRPGTLPLHVNGILGGKEVARGAAQAGLRSRTPLEFAVRLLRMSCTGPRCQRETPRWTSANHQPVTRIESIHRDNMWQPATERLQHFQTMLKSKLNVLTLRKESLPTVVFHEPEDIELRSTTPLAKSRAPPGYKVAYLGKVTISGSQFLSGCTESAVIGLWERRAQSDTPQAHSLLEIRPFQVRLRQLDEWGEASVATETHQVSRIAYCTADHAVSPNVFAWIYRQINDDLTFQMDCHAVECASKVEAKRLAHAMMEAFRLTLHRMHSEGRILSPGDSAPGDD